MKSLVFRDCFVQKLSKETLWRVGSIPPPPPPPPPPPLGKGKVNRSLLDLFIGGYQLGKRISIPIRIYSFKDVSLFYMY